MLTYASVRGNRRELLALTGLTAREFRRLLDSFARVYERRHPAGETESGAPRRRAEGGGRPAVLGSAEDKLLFILTYVKAYPLQVVMARLFGLGQPGVNHWVHRLLPVLREALAELGAVPERDPVGFGGPPAPGTGRPAERERAARPGGPAAHHRRHRPAGAGGRKSRWNRRSTTAGRRRRTATATSSSAGAAGAGGVPEPDLPLPGARQGHRRA